MSKITVLLVDDNLRILSLSDNRSQGDAISPAERLDADSFVLENDKNYWEQITKRIDSNDFNSLNLLSTAQMFACKQIGEHFKIYALLSENIRKKSGDFVVVKFPKIKIQNETDFVIESIERRHPDKTFLILTLSSKCLPKVLPCALTP